MIKKLIVALALLFAANCNAATMWFAGPGGDVMVGDTFDIRIFGDFADEGLIAGGITLFWQAEVVQLENIILELATVEDFSCPGSVTCPPATSNSAPIVWGEFLTNLIEPGQGPTLMATVTFTAIGVERGSLLSIFQMVSNNELTGGWFGAGFTPIADPTFPAIPLPAAVWLMTGGLCTLLGFRSA